MLRFQIAMVVAMSVGTITLAQAPFPSGSSPAPAPVPAVDPLIKAHLENWEKVMGGVSNFAIEKCTLERKNLVRKQQTQFEGTIWCMKPNLARLNLTRPAAAGQKPDPNEFTAYICDGKSVFEYDGSAKQRTEYKLLGGGVGDNLLLEFISGSLTAQTVMERFTIKQLKPEDTNYVFLEITPRLPKDRIEFDTMILVLYHPNGAGKAYAYLPRTVVIRKNAGQEEEIWDFAKPPVMNSNFIKPEHFQAVPPPKDWKIQQAQQAPLSNTAPSGQPGQPGQPVIRPTGR